MEESGVVLLEPVVEVEVVVPAEFMGDVIGALNAKRGSVLGMEPKGPNQVVRALVPLGEMANLRLGAALPHRRTGDLWYAVFALSGSAGASRPAHCRSGETRERATLSGRRAQGPANE